MKDTYSDIFNESNELGNFVKSVLNDDRAKAKKKILLESFIETAIKSPESVEPEITFFIGVLLDRLVKADFKDPVKTLGLQNKHEKKKGVRFANDYQLVADVIYLIDNGKAQGGEGACKLLSDQSPHYRDYKNSNSLQATYRSAVKGLCKWWKIDGDNILGLDPNPSAVSNGRKITKHSIFHKKRDPLK